MICYDKDDNVAVKTNVKSNESGSSESATTPGQVTSDDSNRQSPARKLIQSGPTKNDKGRGKWCGTLTNVRRREAALYDLSARFSGAERWYRTIIRQDTISLTCPVDGRASRHLALSPNALPNVAGPSYSLHYPSFAHTVVAPTPVTIDSLLGFVIRVRSSSARGLRPVYMLTGSFHFNTISNHCFNCAVI